MDPFPVRRVVTLGNRPDGWWRWLLARQLPDHEPGTVRVLAVHGTFYAEAGRHGFPRSLIQNAHAVTYVDTAPRTLEVTVSLRTPPGEPQIKARLGFVCQVRDPVRVARAYLTNLFPTLEGYLAGLRWMRWFSDCSPDEGYTIVQRRAIAQINSRPPRIRGVDTKLAYLHFLSG
jgi:hypothetical protein